MIFQQFPAIRRTAAPLAALVVGAAALLAAPPAPAAESPAPRTVSASGTGEVRAQPDRATVTLGITERAQDLEAARQAANRVVQKLLALTRELGIPDEQVRSTGINVRPEYTWNEPRRERQFAGYVVTRQLVIDLRELERLGALMEKSVSAGANLVQEPVLDSTQRPELERRALSLAVEDARRNAEVLARSVGLSLGTARQVTGRGHGQPGPPQPMMMRASAEMADARESPETYQAGELVFQASADVTFDLAGVSP